MRHLVRVFLLLWAGCSTLLACGGFRGDDLRDGVVEEDGTGADEPILQGDQGVVADTGELDYRLGDKQFRGGFKPTNAPWGGFGGASGCVTKRTPFIFLPGNGDSAHNLDYPKVGGGASVYDELKAAGYTDCELFGLNWLSPAARQEPLRNFHDAAKATMVRDFIRDVLAYTGAAQVDVMGHSMGATVALHGIERASLWPKVRRFIAISTTLRGLGSCWSIGNSNPLGPVCGSQNLFSADTFGLYPPAPNIPNPRMGEGGFRDVPGRAKATRFYALHAGYHDEFLCSTVAFFAGCWRGAVFDAYPNVFSQLDVGYGSTANEVDYDWSDYSGLKAGGGDLDGVGHFRAKNHTGRIQVNMLTTDCTGAACCAGYSDTCGL